MFIPNLSNSVKIDSFFELSIIIRLPTRAFFPAIIQWSSTFGISLLFSLAPKIKKAPCCLIMRGLSNLGLIAKILPTSLASIIGLKWDLSSLI